MHVQDVVESQRAQHANAPPSYTPGTPVQQVPRTVALIDFLTVLASLPGSCLLQFQQRIGQLAALIDAQRCLQCSIRLHKASAAQSSA
jgi:pentose-5-phosphate-3-epimerase